MSSGSFRRILPADLGSNPTNPTASGSLDVEGPIREPWDLNKAPKAFTACKQCKKSKTKCSGARPSCARCLSRKFPCEYDQVPQHQTEEILQKHRELANENAELKTLLHMIETRPEIDAIEIFQRLRASQGAFDVLNFVRQGDLILQQYFPEGSLDDETKVRKLDEDAFNSSSVKVPANPWTAVAGDGLVSELVSSFSAFDYPVYFAFVDIHSFVADMRSKRPEQAQFCTPLLVNAMCALRSHTSRRAKAYGLVRGINLRHAFLVEAKRLLDLESGRTSLPTVQALLIMFVCCVGMGKERAGIIYRSAAHDMLETLRLERDEHPREADVDVYSRALWGIYCFESVSSFAYLQCGLIRKPSYPRRFQILAEDVVVGGGSADERLSPFILDALCDLSEIYNDAMSYNTSMEGEIGGETDVLARAGFLRRVQIWRAQLPPQLQIQSKFSPALFLLSSYGDQVILYIARPLHPSCELPAIGRASDICVASCQHGVEGLERYERQYTLEAYSIMLLYPLYNSTLTLAGRLYSSRERDLLARIARILAKTSVDYPFTAFYPGPDPF